MSAQWMPDSTAKACGACKRDFTLILRRHHCRVCGKIFCDDCSNRKLPIAHHLIVRKPGTPTNTLAMLTTPTQLVRVCLDCWSQHKPGAQQPSPQMVAPAPVPAPSSPSFSPTHSPQPVRVVSPPPVQQQRISSPVPQLPPGEYFEGVPPPMNTGPLPVFPGKNAVQRKDLFGMTSMAFSMLGAMHLGKDDPHLSPQENAIRRANNIQAAGGLTDQRNQSAAAIQNLVDRHLPQGLAGFVVLEPPAPGTLGAAHALQPFDLIYGYENTLMSIDTRLQQFADDMKTSFLAKGYFDILVYNFGFQRHRKVRIVMPYGKPNAILGLVSVQIPVKNDGSAIAGVVEPSMDVYVKAWKKVGAMYISSGANAVQLYAPLNSENEALYSKVFRHANGMWIGNGEYHPLFNYTRLHENLYVEAYRYRNGMLIRNGEYAALPPERITAEPMQPPQNFSPQPMYQQPMQPMQQGYASPQPMQPMQPMQQGYASPQPMQPMQPAQQGYASPPPQNYSPQQQQAYASQQAVYGQANQLQHQAMQQTMQQQQQQSYAQQAAYGQPQQNQYQQQQPQQPQQYQQQQQQQPMYQQQDQQSQGYPQQNSYAQQPQQQYVQPVDYAQPSAAQAEVHVGGQGAEAPVAQVSVGLNASAGSGAGSDASIALSPSITASSHSDANPQVATISMGLASISTEANVASPASIDISLAAPTMEEPSWASNSSGEHPQVADISMNLSASSNSTGAFSPAEPSAIGISMGFPGVTPLEPSEFFASPAPSISMGVSGHPSQAGVGISLALPSAEEVAIMHESHADLSSPASVEAVVAVPAIMPLSSISVSEQGVSSEMAGLQISMSNGSISDTQSVDLGGSRDAQEPVAVEPVAMTFQGFPGLSFEAPADNGFGNLG